MGDVAAVLRPDENLPLFCHSMTNTPTAAYDTRDRPMSDKFIVVCIGTKPEGSSLWEVEIELAVWATAHVSRLLDLLVDSKAGTIDPS
jgi:hypothetical protein